MKEQLNTWKVEPEIPSGFQREVWARIATRETAASRGWFGALELWKLRYALPLFAITLFGSVSLALTQAHEANSQAWRALEGRYAASFNPMVQATAQR